MTGKPPSNPPAGPGGGEASKRPGGSEQTAGTSSSKDDQLPQRIINSAANLSSSVLSSRSIGSPRPEDMGLTDKSGPGPSSSSHAAANQTLATHDGIRTSAISRPRFGETSERDVKSEGKFQGFLGHAPPNVDHGARALETPWRDAQQSGGRDRTVDDQERRDGEEVSALLADPASLQFTDSIGFESVPAQQPRLRAALLGHEGVPSSTWDNLLNFWPVADENLKSSKSAWLAQWDDVLTRYTDEVWGELGADAKQAKEEVEAELEHNEDDEGGLPSLRRLRQILAHLRGS